MPRPLLALLLMSAVACQSDLPSGGDETYPAASLQITYQHPETETSSYTLTCGDGSARVEGADLDADRACAALSDLQVSARLVEGPSDQACSEIYGGADVATIQGTIGGEPVEAVIDRTDGCGIADWELLQPLLPPARGVEVQGGGAS